MPFDHYLSEEHKEDRHVPKHKDGCTPLQHETLFCSMVFNSIFVTNQIKNYRV